MLAQRNKMLVLGALKKETSKKQLNTLFKIIKENEMHEQHYFCNYLVTYDMPNTVYLKETEELLY